MTAQLSPPNRDRLVKLLGLLGSDHMGERAAAGAKASELVKRCGATWSDLIGFGSTARTQQQQQRHERPQQRRPDDNGDLTLCLRHLGAVTAWECQFLQSLQRRRKRSARQAEILADIAASLRKRGMA